MSHDFFCCKPVSPQNKAEIVLKSTVLNQGEMGLQQISHRTDATLDAVNSPLYAPRPEDISGKSSPPKPAKIRFSLHSPGRILSETRLVASMKTNQELSKRLYKLLQII